MTILRTWSAIIALAGMIVSAPAGAQNAPQYPIAFTAQQIEYLSRVLDERPIKEALELVLSIRQQVQAHQQRERNAMIEKARAEEQAKKPAEPTKKPD